MVAGAFPIAKLGVLAVRQISKPLANRIKEKAKSSHFFRTYICMPPAQFYHWLEVTVKMKMLNLGKPSEVPKLNETMAIELGAELLGETIIFSFAALTLIAEYIRQSRKESNKEAEQENRLKSLEHSLESMQQTIKQQTNAIDELTIQYNEVKQKSIIGKLIEEGTRQITGTSNVGNSTSVNNTSFTAPENQGLIDYALFDVTNYFGLKQSHRTDTKSLEEITYIGEPCYICQISSKFGLDYSLPQEIAAPETFHSKKEYERHSFIQKALTDAVAILKGDSKQSLKYHTLKLAKPSQKRTGYADLKYPQVLTKKHPNSLFHQSITNASECIIGKKDTRKFEFDSQFLTAVDIAEEIADNILYDFNLAEIAEDASSVFFGEPDMFSNLNNKFPPSAKYRINKHKDHQIKIIPGLFEQALHDAVGCIVEERENNVKT